MNTFPPFGADEAMAWTTALVAWATLTSSFELVFLRHQLRPHGLWGTRWLFDGSETPGARRWQDRIFGSTMTMSVIATRIASSFLLCWIDSLLPAFLLLVTTLFLAYRWRGSVNGGSDTMSVQIALCLCGDRLARGEAQARVIALSMIAALLVLSYCAAGFAKIPERTWRNGRALDFFLSHHPLSRGRNFAHFLRCNRLLGATSWGLLSFELAFPCTLFSPKLAGIFLAIGAGFHVINALIFGLHRFVWIWLAAYPALYWFALEGRQALQNAGR